MDVYGILRDICGTGLCYDVLVEHSRMVYGKACRILEVSGRVLSESEGKLLYEGCMLHDIGVSGVNYPRLGCMGSVPYIRHGLVGGEILRGLGFEAHARICERHIGVGISRDDIIRGGLDLPLGDYLPESFIEKLVCYADLFYSKRPGALDCEESAESIRLETSRFGSEQLRRLDALRAEVTGGHQVDYPV